MKKLNRLLLLAAMTLVAVLPLRAADYVFVYDGGYLYVTNGGTVGYTEEFSASCVWTCVSSTSQLTTATLTATATAGTETRSASVTINVTPVEPTAIAATGTTLYVGGTGAVPYTLTPDYAYHRVAVASGNTGIFTVTSPATSGAVDITPVILAIPFPVRMPIAFSTVVRGDWLWRAEKLQVLQAA